MNEIVHARTIARERVQVNARNNVSAYFALAQYYPGMDSSWLPRLKSAIRSDERSYSKLAQDAGLGRNFIQQLLKDNKEPGADKLSAILSVLGEDVALYVVTGIKIQEGDLAFLRAVSRLTDEEKQDALRFFERLASSRDAVAREDAH